MADSSNRETAANQAGDRPENTTRRSGLRALATTMPRVARRALGRRGFADAGLISDWPAVVGQTIAANSQPLRLTFANAKDRRDGTLLLRVAPGFALELQHLEPQLLERINGHFGYAAVARLKIQQGPVLGPKRSRPRHGKPLPAEEEMRLSARLEEVQDEEMRQSLERLGRSFGRRTMD